MFKKITALFLLINFSACSIGLPNDTTSTPSTESASGVYYGRSLLTGELLRTYDYLYTQIHEWEDNANELGETYNIKEIPLYRLGYRVTREDLLRITSYIKKDIPKAYMLNQVPRYTTTDSGYIDVARLRFNKTPNFSSFSNSMNLINTEVNKILAKVTPEMSEFDKVKLAHDELLKIVSYGGMSSGSAGDIYGAFIDFIVVCEGYANALLYILQKMGIMGIYIDGYATNGSSSILHAWNKVRIDGKWYNIDPTWNDGMGNNSYVFHDYFLLSDSDFNKVNGMDTTHTPKTTDTYSYSTLPTSSQSYPMDR